MMMKYYRRIAINQVRMANDNMHYLKIICVAILIALIFLSVIYVSTIYFGATQISHQNSVRSFTINNKTYNFTRYAYNLSEWEHGLMNSTINNKTFMLFEFNKSSIWNFWMYNTYTNLDIIWINASQNISNNTYGKIVYIVKNASACINSTQCPIYTPTNNSNYVIETKFKFLDNNNVIIGQKIKFNR